MKKAISVFLAAIMLLSVFSAAVSAADTDIVFSTSQNHTVSFVKYGSFTVKSGVNVTLVNCGFEIAGSLNVENGGSLTGVEQGGEFCFSLKRGCTVSGVDLYYPDNNGDKIEYRLIPLSVFDDWSKIEDDAMAFKWNTSINGWCLTHNVNGNPYGVIFYHTERDMGMAEEMANQLFSLGLFKGTGTKADGSPEFSLNRAPTRVEAIVMLIRLLGKENEALGGQWNNPFTDVPDWADKYIGYAYEKGLTKGTSSTTFGTANATLQQYLTFVLRALGYTDADTSSTLYDEAIDFGNRINLSSNDHPETEYLVCKDDFLRADVAVISYRALETNTKNGLTLRESLNSGELPQNTDSGDENELFYESIVAYANWTDNSAVFNNCENIDRLTESSGIHLPIFRFTSVSELNAFRESIDGILSTEQGYDGLPSYYESVRSFDDTFFSKYTLLLVYVPSNSGSFRYGVRDISVDKDVLTVGIEQLNHPETYTDDMSGWYVFTTVQTDEVAGCIYYDAVILPAE